MSELKKINTYILYSVIKNKEGEEKLFPFIVQTKEEYEELLKIDFLENSKVFFFLGFKKATHVKQKVMTLLEGKENDSDSIVLDNNDLTVEYIEEILLDKDIVDITTKTNLLIKEIKEKAK